MIVSDSERDIKWSVYLEQAEHSTSNEVQFDSLIFYMGHLGGIVHDKL
jgi:hypothetical protein